MVGGNHAQRSGIDYYCAIDLRAASRFDVVVE